MYYAIFHFHLLYVCTAWGQNLNPKHRTNLLQNKAIQIISFAQYDAHTLPIFAKLHVIKFSDLISLYNCSSINILLVRLLQFFHMFSFQHPTHMNKTLGLHCMCCFCYSIMEFFPKIVSH